MTTKEKFKILLTQRGMSPKDADKALEGILKKTNDQMEKTAPNYRITWDRPAEEYPEPFYAIMWATLIKGLVAGWIKENMPQAWFLPLFEE